MPGLSPGDLSSQERTRPFGTQPLGNVVSQAVLAESPQMQSQASHLFHMPPFLSAAGLGGSTDVPRKTQGPIWMLVLMTEAARGFCVRMDNSPMLTLQDTGPAVGSQDPGLCRALRD